MQCPSCGFFNLPGTEKCTVCSTSLAAKAPTESVMPPRARDRNALGRLSWRITNSDGWKNLRTGLSSIRVNIPRPAPRTRPRFRVGFNLRQIGCTIASIIPGMGHVLAMRKAGTGFIILLSSFLSLLLALVLYKTVLSDYLVIGVIGLSAFSVATTIDAQWKVTSKTRSRSLRHIGIVLVVVSLYLGTYVAVRSAMMPQITFVNVTMNISNTNIVARDQLLIRKMDRYYPGDIVMNNVAMYEAYGVAAGPVLGVPGDKVELLDQVYINGRPKGILTNINPSSYVSKILSSDEYFVMPMFAEGELVADGPTILQAGSVRSSDIHGRVVAVTNPPAHRKLYR